MVTELIGKAGGEPRAGIGIGASGPVDPRRGLIKNPYTLPDAYQGCVTQRLADVFGVPVRLENDSTPRRSARRGRSRRGRADRRVRHRGDRRRRRRRPERPDCPRCGGEPSRAGPPCHRSGRPTVLLRCQGLRRVACFRQCDRRRSGPRWHRAFGQYCCGRVRPAATLPECRWIIERSRAALALAVRNLAVLYAPDVIVLAGNALGDPEAVLEAARREAASYTLGPPGGVRLSLSQLAGMAGCIGAAGLVFVPQDAS